MHISKCYLAQNLSIINGNDNYDKNISKYTSRRQVKIYRNNEVQMLTPKPKESFFFGESPADNPRKIRGRCRTKMLSGLPNHLYFCHDIRTNFEIDKKVSILFNSGPDVGGL